MRVLVTIIAPVYWSLAHAGGEARSGFLLTQGTFRHESQLEFATGEGRCGPQARRGLRRLVLPGSASVSPMPCPWGLSPLLGWASQWRWSCIWGCQGLQLTAPLPAGELLRVTHLARGADAADALLLDSVISGSVPESIGEATVLLQVPVLPVLPAGP